MGNLNLTALIACATWRPTDARQTNYPALLGLDAAKVIDSVELVT
jgi:hypothetical protein